MKRNIAVPVVFTLLALILFAPAASAGVFGDTTGKAWDWVKGEALSAILIGLFSLLFAVVGVLYLKIARTFKEGGEALTQLGNAMISRNRKDAEKILPEIRDVYDIWKTTPDRYRVDGGVLEPFPVNAPNNPANPGQ